MKPVELRDAKPADAMHLTFDQRSTNGPIQWYRKRRGYYLTRLSAGSVAHVRTAKALDYRADRGLLPAETLRQAPWIWCLAWRGAPQKGRPIRRLRAPPVHGPAPLVEAAGALWA